jgi:hypothetical protein
MGGVATMVGLRTLPCKHLPIRVVAAQRNGSVALALPRVLSRRLLSRGSGGSRTMLRTLGIAPMSLAGGTERGRRGGTGHR